MPSHGRRLPCLQPSVPNLNLPPFLSKPRLCLSAPCLFGLPLALLGFTLPVLISSGILANKGPAPSHHLLHTVRHLLCVLWLPARSLAPAYTCGSESFCILTACSCLSFSKVAHQGRLFEIPLLLFGENVQVLPQGAGHPQANFLVEAMNKLLAGSDVIDVTDAKRTLSGKPTGF